MSHFTYLAIPYTVNPQESYAWSLQAVSIYAQNRVPCYSPIVHMHPVAEKYDLPKDFGFWGLMDKTMIKASGAVHILVPKGWDDLVKKSKGVKLETRYGHGLGKLVHVVTLDGDKSKIHEDEAEILHALLYGE